MKVLITTPNLELPGGVANFYRVLRRYLDHGTEYFQVGPSPGEKGGFGALRRLVADSWRFHRALASRHVELVHLNPSLVPRALLRDGLLVLIARLHRCPTLVLVHGWDPKVQSLIETRFRRLFLLVFGSVDGLVVLAAEFRQVLVDLGVTCPVYVETTLVDDEVFAVPLAARRNQGGTAAANLLYLSRLEKEKGLIETIEAFALLRETHSGITLTVVGEGPERVGAEALVLAKRIPGVTFLGHIEGAAKVRAFTDADVYVLPTYYAEGMPTSVLEAMAYGLPVVTRPVGGLKDFFEDGRMGYWTESREASEIAAVLGRLLADPERLREIGAYNRAYARERFAASRLAERLRALYQLTLERAIPAVGRG